MAVDYSSVTEVPGAKASRQQLTMLYSRYVYAAKFVDGRDMLEVACGSGIGLRYLARRARRAVGGDYTDGLLRIAQRHHGAVVPLVRLDATNLPFEDACFDVIVLYEAIYYLLEPEQFVMECRRVLRPDGVLLLCSVNREWAGFNPSPFSTRYLGAGELEMLLGANGFAVELLGAFPEDVRSRRGRLTLLARRIAVALRIIPKTMKGKELLKRIVFGRLIELGADIEGFSVPYAAPELLRSGAETRSYKVLYAVGRVTARARLVAR
jgi:SAM-dependent methyltransferase